MQKKVIALAIAGLFSGAAFAQSALAPLPPGPTSVTMYGTLDVGVVMDNSGYGNNIARLGFFYFYSDSACQG